MRDELLSYYERELAYVRQLGAEFAQKYPKVAQRLQLEPNRCEDPHVERLIEAFAFLAARVHLKIDDEFPELTQALLGILYPHYVRPLPSMTIAEFRLDPDEGQVTTGLDIARSTLLNTRSASGVRCQFRTCYDLSLWPLTVAQAQWTQPERLDPPMKATDGAHALRLLLRAGHGVELSKLDWKSLRFFLNGEPSFVYPLYEYLLNNAVRVVLRDPTPRSRVRPIILSPKTLQPVGFTDEEAMLPYPRRSFTGYRLLQEYFAFPEKFLFVDFTGLEALQGSEFGQDLEIVVLFSDSERNDWDQILQLGVNEKVFRTGCVPAINLFPLTADPILVEQTRFEYPVVPDARRRDALEVFSLESVTATNPVTNDVVPFEPFYSYRHTSQARGPQVFWHATRRPATERFDESTELWLTLVDLAGKPTLPNYDTLTVRCLCTNRELPSRLSFGNEAGDFEAEGASAVAQIVALRKPTNTVRPALSSGALWRLISHLSLNYLSLVEEGREALQEILRLYTPGASNLLERQIEGIAGVSSKRHFTRVISEQGISFVRGTRVELELNEEYFVGAGAYLFASVLEHFLGLYASMNSFSQMSLKSRQRKEVVRIWPARAGHRILV